MKIALIIAQNNFRDEEYEVPKKTFEDAGFETTTLSKTTGICTSKFKKTVQATDSIDNIDVADYMQLSLLVVVVLHNSNMMFKHI